MTIQIPEFNPVLFCESLYMEACKAAKPRVAKEPTPSQLLMLDLVAAFRNLRHMDHTDHFGLIAGEWNEAIAIIKTYIAAANHKAPKTLHPELGVIIGTLIEGWGRFPEIPKELQTQVRKAKKVFQETEDTFMERLDHFFNEMKVRVGSLESPEKDGVGALITLYQPQARNACLRGEVDETLHLLHQLDMDLNRLALQGKVPSRRIEQLVIKTRHDLTELDSFGNKGKKGKKKVGTR